jgi:hypothetical protein
MRLGLRQSESRHVPVAEYVHVTYQQYGGKIAGEAIVKREDYATESALSDAFTAALKERGEALPHKTPQPAHDLN